MRTIPPTDAERDAADRRGNEWSSRVIRDDVAAERAVASAISSGALPPEFASVWASNDVYDATQGQLALLAYWPQSALRKAAPWLHIVKGIISPHMEVTVWEERGKIITPSRARAADDVSHGGDDSGGWFGDGD